MTGMVAASTTARMRLSPPRGMIRSISPSARAHGRSRSARSGLSIMATASAGRPASATASRSIAAMARLEWSASLPPRRMQALPLLRHSPAASAVTLGRDLVDDADHADGHAALLDPQAVGAVVGRRASGPPGRPGRRSAPARRPWTRPPCRSAGAGRSWPRRASSRRPSGGPWRWPPEASAGRPGWPRRRPAGRRCVARPSCPPAGAAARAAVATFKTYSAASIGGSLRSGLL